MEKKSVNLLLQGLEKLSEGFELPEIDNLTDYDKMEEIIKDVALRLQDNYPYFHPYYLGQMLKPPHPVARAAYQLAMWVNPNNHALDGGRASSQMEKEVVADIARMFGYENHLGHLTSGGTMANMEALWVAGLERPGETILASDQAHYTHSRLCGVLKIPYEAVPGNRSGKMDIGDLKKRLAKGGIGTVVVTMGTTGLGAVDDLEEILGLQETYGFRIHADAAYGGYFRLADNLFEKTTDQYAHLDKADSIVIDPHKHGLQPYGCGCVLFRNPEMARHYLHDSPYTYFTSDDLHLGEISLECSRAGASAVGLWATHRLLPPVENGAFAADLEKCRNAAIRLAAKVGSHDAFLLVQEPELDIVVWAIRGDTTSQMSQKADDFFQQAADKGIHLSKLKLAVGKVEIHGATEDSETITCIRCCLLKPEHLDWIDRIWEKMME